MSYGITIYRANGTVLVDNNTIGHLYIDDVAVPTGTTTLTYQGAGQYNITAIGVGDATNLAPVATVNIATSGNNKVITINATTSGRFRILME